MKLKSTYFIALFFAALLMTPMSSWAFFTNSKINIVQEGTFSHNVPNEATIEDVLDEYTLCEDGDWDTYTSDKNEEIVTYQCTYSTKEAIKSNLKALNIKDAELEKETLANLEDKDFALDVLITFTVNEEKETFTLNNLQYLYKGQEQAASPEQLPIQVKNLLEKKPLTLPLLYTSGKAGKIFAYTLEKLLLKSEESINYTAPFYENLGFTYSIKNAPQLTAKLSDLAFDDKTQQIKAKLAFSLQVPGKKIDVEKEKGYFIKYFRAALSGSPKVLQSQTFDVYLRPNHEDPTIFTFEDKDKNFVMSFAKKSLMPLKPKAIKVSYKGAIEPGVKDYIKKNTDTSASPQGVINELLGNFVYEAEGMKGSVRILPDANNESTVKVYLNTVNVQALHLCEYEGNCTFTENKYLCPIKDAPEGMESFFEIVPSDTGFSISQNPSLLCGVRGFMSGDYSRCNEQTSGPLTMVLVPMEIIHEDATYIVRFTDDGAESLEFVSQKQAEFLEKMIGKNVLVHYNQSQMWNEEKKFCNRSKEIISVEDATKPEAKLLGGYSHASAELKGYAFIEPDFTAKSAFNIHLNNYSNDLEKNCQFAGDCYAEGEGFICNTFDREQNPDEYFELVPSKEGFIVLNNPTNTCTYEGFMSGKYEKCDNKIFSRSSISGQLKNVNEEDFMYTHIIIVADKQEIDMRIGVDQIALAKSLIGKDVLINFVDEQYWGEHDRACVREKRVTSIQAISAVKNSLVGNYGHNADGISGSAIISEVENTPDSFVLTLKNLGLNSKASCSFSGVCEPNQKGFLCKSMQVENNTPNYITVIPSADGFSIPVDISNNCKMRSLHAGKYSKCVKKTLGSASVTGLFTEIIDKNKNEVSLVIIVQGQKHLITLPKSVKDFKRQLDLLKDLLGKNVTVNYSEEQSWNDQDKLCTRVRYFTSIKTVKSKQDS